MKEKLKIIFLKHFRAIKYIAFMLYILMLLYNEQTRENLRNFLHNVYEFVMLQPLPAGAEPATNYYLANFPGYEYKDPIMIFISCITILIIVAILKKLTERFRANFKDYHSMPKNTHSKGNNRFMNKEEKKDRFFYQEWGNYHFDGWLFGVEEITTVRLFGFPIYKRSNAPFKPRNETYDMKEDLKKYKEV